MKTALLSALPFLLLFAFSTQRLTLAAEDNKVLDINDEPLVSGEPYHILDANNHKRGVQLTLIGPSIFPIPVVIGTDPKKVAVKGPPGPIYVEEEVDLEFVQDSLCAKSLLNWTVQVPGNKKYPVVIGPDGYSTVNGSFCITNKPKDSSSKPHEYYIAFKFCGKDEYVLTTTEVAGVDLCHLDFSERSEKLKVVFKPVQPGDTAEAPPLTSVN